MKDFQTKIENDIQSQIQKLSNELKSKTESDIKSGMERMFEEFQKKTESGNKSQMDNILTELRSKVETEVKLRFDLMLQEMKSQNLAIDEERNALQQKLAEKERQFEQHQQLQQLLDKMASAPRTAGNNSYNPTRHTGLHESRVNSSCGKIK